MLRKRTIDVIFVLFFVFCMLVGSNNSQDSGVVHSTAPLENDYQAQNAILSQVNENHADTLKDHSSNGATHSTSTILVEAPFNFTPSTNMTGLPFCDDKAANCFYGSVEDIVFSLEKTAQVYLRLCGLQSKPRIARLVEVAGIVGYTEGFSQTNPVKLSQSVQTSINSLGTFSEFRFSGYLRELQLSFQENVSRTSLIDRIWSSISDELDTIVRQSNYPFFVRRSVWQLIQNIRMVNMLKVRYTANCPDCLPNNWKFINNLWEFSTTPNFVTIFKPIQGTCKTNVLEIKEENFINGGIVYTFWGFENLAQIKHNPKNVFNGYISNRLVYQYSLVSGQTQVIHKFNFLGEQINIPSNSNCADYFFVTLAFQKDCDKYRFSWSVRFLASNTRQYGSRVVFADNIENTNFNFNNEVTFNHHLFRNIKYNSGQEILFMSYTSDKNLVAKLQERATCNNQNGKCNYSDLTKCVVCKAPHVNFKGTCVSTCPDGTYRHGTQGCKPCHPNCTRCVGPLNGSCITCKLGLFNNNGTCAPRCPDNMFPKQEVCNKCGENCLKCRDNTNCSKCSSTTFLYNGVCYPTCGKWYYPSYQPNVCNPCSQGCEKCSGPTKCTVCDKGLFLKNGQCVKNCGDRFYANTSNSTCQPCATGCLRCNNPKTCIECEKGLVLSKRTQTCNNKCGPGNASVNGACTPCTDKNCRRCSATNLNECRDCHNNFFLKTGKCVPNCGEGYYSDNRRNCKPCTRDCKICTQDKCLQCFDNKVVFQNTRCLNECVDGYVRSGNTCVKCDTNSNCRKCTVNNLSICTHCYPGQLLYAGKCVTTCPPKHYSNGQQCLPCQRGCEVCKNGDRCIKCENNFFLKHHVCVDCCGVGYTESNGTCKACTVHDCDLCPPTNLGRCEKCLPGKFLYNNQCHKVCPLGTYPNSNGGCEQCGPGCALCRDQTTCQKCVIGKVLQGKNCPTQCNDGFIAINGVCTPCQNYRCKQCDPQLVRCTQCPLGSYMHNGDCVKVCPDGTYLDKGSCLPCNKPCLECSNKNTCTTCINGFYLINGKCTDQCPERMVLSNGKCVPCKDPYCRKCNQDDTTTCILCDANRFLHQGKCLHVCHAGFYAQSNVCHPCTKGCAECTNSQKCTTCNAPFKLFENSCLNQCPSGTVQRGNTCVKCNPKCKTCNPNNTDVCTTCPTPYKLYQGRCLPQCPEGTFANGLGQCSPCQTKNCRRCPGGLTCIDCLKGLVLQNNQCVNPPCSSGYVLRTGTNKCVPCDVKNCEKCHANDLKTCTQCVAPNLLLNGRCVPTCPNGFYRLDSIRSCLPCSGNCSKCNDITQCVQCDKNYYLFDARCRPACPNGYTRNEGKCVPCDTKNCATCTPNGKTCLECNRPLVLNNNKCVPECPLGKWSLLNKCINCQNGCAQCCDGTQCEKCLPGKVLTSDGKCVDTCPRKYALINGRCVKCNFIRKCIKCDNLNLSRCVDCKPGYFILNGQCVKKCGNGFTTIAGKCVPCSQNCSLCNHPSTCVECDKNYHVLDGKCVPQCPPGTYSRNGKCNKCSEKCVTCNSNSCVVCQKDSFLLNGRCVNVCPNGTYANGNTCNNCDKYCQTCTSPSTCQVCKDGFLLYNGVCYTECCDGTVATNGRCVPCGPGCNKCNKLNTKECTKCQSPNLLLNGQCVQRCPIGFYSQNGECKPCLKGCDICTNAQTCTRCTIPLLLTNNATACSNTCPDGYKPDLGRCAPCTVEKCKTCSGNVNRCLGCSLPNTILDNKCVPRCPHFYYYRSQDGTQCKKCPAGCLTCSYKQCFTCIDGFTINNGVCTNQCKKGETISNGKCTPCTIDKCEVCDKTNQKCLKCKSGYSLDIVNANGACVQSCRKGWFDNKGVCEPCVTNCNKCFNNRECAECRKGYVVQNSQCVIRCSDNYVQRDLRCHKCNDANCKRCDPTTQSVCSVCNDGYYLKNGKCVKECGTGFYSYKIGENQYACRPCDKNCNLCKGPMNCNVCQNGYKNKKGECVTECGLGFTLNPNTNTCTQCLTRSCVRCDYNDAANCILCSPRLFGQGGQCVTRCSAGYRPNGSTCEPCTDKNCLTCRNAANQCQRCVLPFLVLNGKCVPSCPNGMSNRNGVCVPCTDPNCNKCHPIKTNQCVTCRDGFISDTNKTCRQNCPAGTYNWNNVKCLPCPGNCSKCADQNTCIECKNGFNLTNGKKCSDRCPNGQVRVNGVCVDCVVKNCKKCLPSNLNHCVTCKTGIPYRGTCHNFCPPGTYRIGHTCRPCTHNCRVCTNGQNCINCSPPQVLQGRFCVNKCNDGYFPSNGVCKQCPNFRYVKHCPPSPNPPVCRERFFLLGNQCVPNCPNGTNADRNRVCQPCGNNCLQCQEKNNCQKCDAKTVLLNGRCLPVCPNGFVNLLGVCKQCQGLNCSICLPQNVNHCVDCNKPFVTLRGVCVPSCPNGTFRDGNRCRKCDTQCETCTQKGSCVTCKPQFTIQNGQCVSNCQQGNVLVSKTCIACQDPNCRVCSSLNINNCHQCDPGFILFRNQCIKKCPTGMYMDPKSNTCEPCHRFCNTCTSTTCTQCADSFYPFARDPRHCVPCRDNQHVIENGMCTKCKPAYCLKCVAGNSNRCEVCHISRILINGQCESHCPLGFYRSGQVCLPCGANCQNCRNNQQCRVCKPPFINFRGTCLNECPPNYVFNGKDGCNKCAQPTCDKCDKNLVDCKKCIFPSILYNNRCFRTCPDGSFRDNETCKPCKTGCQLCNAKTCLKCHPGLKLKGSECVEQCGTGFVDRGKRCSPCSDTNCAVCSPENKCHRCNNPYLLNYNGACVIDCKDGTYRDNNQRKCVPCNKGCELCTGNNQCTKCEKGLYLHNGVCLNKCPLGFAPSGSKCVPCEDKNCQKCSSAAHYCEACKAPLNVFNNKCVPNCPSGYYTDNGRCRPCSKRCEQCTSYNNCTKCKPEFNLSNGKCLNNCADGKVLINNRCIPCSDNNCKTCLTNVNICVDCKNPFVLHENLCRTTCPDGFYVDKKNNCAPCGVGCAQCKSSNSCTKCKDEWYLHNEQCIKTCPLGYFGECKEKVCRKCNDACEVCTDNSSTNCKHCTKGFYLNGSSCVKAENCRKGTYASDTTRKCTTCTIPFCATCLDFDTCDVCVNGYTVNKNGGCTEAKTFVNVIPQSPKLLSQITYSTLRPSEVFNFNNNLKGIAVGSNTVSITFFLRRITEYYPNTVLFQTTSTEPSKPISFEINNNSCFLNVGNSSNRVADCSYNSLYNWRFFTIVLNKITENATVTVLVGTPNGPAPASRISTTVLPGVKWVNRNTELRFNGNGNTNAFELAQFNVFDYVPNRDDINKHFRAKPVVCDYSCTDCRERCLRCPGNVAPQNGLCPAVYVPVANDLQVFTNKPPVSLRSKVTRRVDSRNYAFTTWFYSTSNTPSYTVGRVFYPYVPETPLIEVSVTNGNLAVSVNSENINTVGCTVRPNKWYHVGVTVSRGRVNVWLTPRGEPTNSASQQIQRPIRLLTEDVSFGVGNFQGSYFDGRVYVNNVPTPDNVKQHHNNLRCTENCNICNQYLRCILCRKGFQLDQNYKCVDNDLGGRIPALDKYSFFNKDTYTLFVPNQVYSKPFSFSFWYRKKIHSVPNVPPQPFFNVLSYASSSQPSKLIPLVTETIHPVTTYTSKFTVGEDCSPTKDFVENFSNEVYSWIHFVLNFYPNNRVLTIHVKNDNNVQFVGNYTINPHKFVFGDPNGSDMNFEIGNAFFYTRPIKASNLPKVRQTEPKDCDPSCVKCNYFTGYCNECNIKKPGVNLSCPNMLLGYASAYTYGVNTYDPARGKLFSSYLKNTFTRDVNSLEYSVIGYFRLLDNATLNANKNNRFSLFTVSNRQDEKKSPSNYLMALHIRTQNGNPNFLWVTNDHNTVTETEIVGLPVKPNAWYFVYATINVVQKRLDFAFHIEEPNARTLVGDLKFNNFPEKLQERGALTLFGIGQTLPKDYKIPDAHFYYFYLSPNLGWNPDVINKYRQTYPIKPDPKCASNCAKCIHDYSRDVDVCLKCAKGYEMNNDKCVKTKNANYIILSDQFNTNNFLPPKTNFNLPNTVVISTKSTLAFYLQRNFVPRVLNGNRVILNAGNLSVSLLITQSTAATLVFEINGTSQSVNLSTVDFDLDNDYDWYLVLVQYSANSVRVIVKNEKSSISTDQKLEFNNVNLNVKSMNFNSLDEEVSIYGPHILLNNFYNEPLFGYPKLDCGVDCNACVNNKCLDCQYGMNALGHCRNKPVKTRGFQVRKGSNYTNRFPIGNYLGEYRFLRSNSWTLAFTFETTTDISEFNGRLLFRLQNTKTTEYDPNLINDNLFSVKFNKDRSFFLSTNTRRSQSQTKSSRGWVSKSLKPAVNRQYFVGLIVDDDNDKIHFLVYNSPNNYILETFAFEEVVDNLINRGTLIFGEGFERDLVGLTFNNVRFYYENIQTVEHLQKLAKRFIVNYQNVCTSSSRVSCYACSQGMLVRGDDQHRFCSPLKTTYSWKINHVEQYNERDQNSTCATPIPVSNPLNSFTFSFWYRRLSYTNDPHGIISLGKAVNVLYDSNVLTINIADPNCDVIGTIRIPNLYGKTDGFDWLHISVSVNLQTGAFHVLVHNSRTGTNSYITSQFASKNFGSLFKLPVTWSWSSNNCPDDGWTFEVSSLIYTPNYYPTDSNQVTLYRVRVPINCESSCANICDRQNICVPNNRYQTQFLVPNVVLNSPTCKPTLYNSIKNQFRNNTTSSFNKYLIGFELNINHLQTSNYRANRNTLINLVNEAVDCNKSMNDTIPDSNFKYGVLSVELRTNALRFYIGGSEVNNYVSFYDFIFDTNSFNTLNNIHVVFYVNVEEKYGKIIIYLDDLRSSYEIRTVYPPQPIYSETEYYVHPAVSNFRVNVHNSRINVDFFRNILSRSYANVYSSNLCKSRKNCEKCAVISKSTSLFCLRCTNGFKMINNMCLREKSFN